MKSYIEMCGRTVIITIVDKDNNLVEPTADDYLTKPFSVSELLARVTLRNQKQSIDNKNMVHTRFEVRGLKVDIEMHRVFINDEEIHLTPVEYKIIELMSKYLGRVLTHKFIVNEI